MFNFKAITIDYYRLEPPRFDLDPKDEILAMELLKIFSLEEVTKFNHNYRLSTPYDAEQRIHNISLAFHERTSYTYRLYDTTADKLIGTIELRAPVSVDESHPSISRFCFRTGNAVRNDIWSVEYYLHPNYWRQRIMTRMVSAVIEELVNQNAKCVVAVCHYNNTPGNKFLLNLKFIRMIQYKNMKNHHLWIKKINV